MKLIESFCDWIDGCHNYRHEHSQEHVIEPPLEIVVEYVSSGASYLRWLIEIDAQTNKPGLKVVAR
jgi:hypothetical protein